ncbi:hypothetical protein HNP84_004928 [Thermocatellispora tengchongensis]|uniref:Uncharacterized protein n=1 Tax=Thermocatellispora tengchongensis TaxID=1073253 RepID=A0A840P798_9ACTN|nr:hypothetical protein [Thermocatellispora tengchongensis]
MTHRATMHHPPRPRHPAPATPATDAHARNHGTPEPPTRDHDRGEHAHPATAPGDAASARGRERERRAATGGGRHGHAATAAGAVRMLPPRASTAPGRGSEACGQRTATPTLAGHTGAPACHAAPPPDDHGSAGGAHPAPTPDRGRRRGAWGRPTAATVADARHLNVRPAGPATASADALPAGGRGCGACGRAGGRGRGRRVTVAVRVWHARCGRVAGGWEYGGCRRAVVVVEGAGSVLPGGVRGVVGWGVARGVV